MQDLAAGAPSALPCPCRLSSSSRAVRLRAGVAIAAGLLLSAPPAFAKGKGVDEPTTPISIAPVDAGDWADLTKSAEFGPQLAKFQDDDVLDAPENSGGVSVFEDTDVTAGLISGNKAGSVDSLIVLLTASPDAILEFVRLTLVDASGTVLEGTKPVVLDPTEGINWLAAGFEDTTPGWGNQQDPFPRPEGEIAGAVISFSTPLEGTKPDTLLAMIRYEIVGMTAGSIRIDYLGLVAGTGYDPGTIRYNSSNSGGAFYSVGKEGCYEKPPEDPEDPTIDGQVPEPGSLGLALLGLGVLASRARRLRRSKG
jgi:hypothetical protein